MWHGKWSSPSHGLYIPERIRTFFNAAMKGSRCEVVPFVFSLKSKNDLGWAFVGAIESGRYKEYQGDEAAETRRFWGQVEGCEYTVDAGPGRVMR